MRFTGHVGFVSLLLLPVLCYVSYLFGMQRGRQTKAADAEGSNDNDNPTQSKLVYEDGFEHLQFNEKGFPLIVPLVDVRRDSKGKPVEPGRLEKLGGVSKFMKSNGHNWLNNGDWNLWSNRKAVRLREFKETLQCAEFEPDLDGPRAILSLIRLLGGVTRRYIELAAAWIESQKPSGPENGFRMVGGCSPWAECKRRAEKWKRGENVPKQIDNFFVRLVRVSEGKLYIDWPWKSGRIWKRPDFNVIRLFAAVLEIVKDMPDSVFFTMTYDRPLFPSNYPIPVFSHSPTLNGHSDIPFPWPRIINDEVEYYDEQLMRKKTTKYPNLDPTIDAVWKSRLEKAGFYGMLWERNPAALSRQVMLDLSFVRPDLIDAKFTSANPMNPYNPASDEEMFDMKIPRRSKRHLPDDQHGITGLNETHIPGFVKTLRNKFQRIQEKKDIYIKRYKYLVVLAGNSGADRLATFFAHSGSVILLQETDYLSHFTSRLKPWIHYVPIAYNAADLIEKVLWLKAHDAMARRIARNGWVFGKSYLRLEDYYCYAATAMEKIALIESGSNALQHFNSTPIESPWLRG